MSGGFNNPIVGGAGALIRAALKSPNYVAGLLGWSVNRDGSAEFNNATFRGDVKITGGTNASGIYVYDTGEALGSLVASMTPDSSPDDVGNDVYQGFTGNAYCVKTPGSNDASNYPVWSPDGGDGGIWSNWYAGNQGQGFIWATIGNELARWTNALLRFKKAVRFDDVVGFVSSVTFGGTWQLGAGPIGRYYYEEFTGPNVGQNVTTAQVTVTTGWIQKTLISDYPTGSMAVATGTWTAPEDGIYTFTYAISWTTWTAGSRIALWFRRIIGGTTEELFQAEDGSSALGIYAISRTFFVPKGGQVRAMVFQATGATRTIRNTIQALSIYRNP